MQERNQTDFGGILFNLPSQVYRPKSISELAALLAECNEHKKPVTVRNSGHSGNGQTLTSGVQIQLSELRNIHFDKTKKEVTFEAGIQWHDILEKIEFPKYCPPLYPNNPGQRIHATGNASVGGVGTQSSKIGGLWNHVIKIKLVTMKGDVIHCSRDENPDYFRFALSGFGRIGIIAEMTLPVKKSKKFMTGIALAYYDEQTMIEDMRQLTKDSKVDSITVLSFIGNKLTKHTHLEIGMLGVMSDVSDDAEVKTIFNHLKENYHSKLQLGIVFDDDTDKRAKVVYHPRRFPKKNFVYFYPNPHGEPEIDLCHLWLDLLIPAQKFHDASREIGQIIKKHQLEDFLRKETTMDEWDHLPSYVSYPIIKTQADKDGFFPLSLHTNEDNLTVGIAIEPSFPKSMVPRAEAMTNELIDFIYAIGGKIYPYSYHNLSKNQTILHYNRGVIKKWNELKEELDPNFLLNIGSVKNVDYM